MDDQLFSFNAWKKKEVGKGKRNEWWKKKKKDDVQSPQKELFNFSCFDSRLCYPKQNDKGSRHDTERWTKQIQTTKVIYYVQMLYLRWRYHWENIWTSDTGISPLKWFFKKHLTVSIQMPCGRFAIFIECLSNILICSDIYKQRKILHQVRTRKDKSLSLMHLSPLLLHSCYWFQSPVVGLWHHVKQWTHLWPRLNWWHSPYTWNKKNIPEEHW